MSDPQRRALRLVALGLAVAAIFVVAPLWLPLLLAAWIADLVQAPLRTLQRRLGGRRRGAAALVVLLIVAVLVPLAAIGAAVAVGAEDLFAELRAALEGRGSLAGVLLGGRTATPMTLRDWAVLASRHSANVWHALTLVAQTSVSALLGILVFVVTLYALAAGGARSYRWLARHSPLPPRALGRFTRAFRETGRGLIIGGGGTALVQGIVATIAYVAIGIPRALLLGPVTALCALVPVVGTALVWAPLAMELAIAGDYVRAVIVAIVGAGIIGGIDNVVRPILARHGRLDLPTAIVLISMLGGIAAFGPTGALLGPLAVRLAFEALAMLHEERVEPPFSARRSPSPRTRAPRLPQSPPPPAP
jgi:predicted PurR-regulated permease PerM